MKFAFWHSVDHLYYTPILVSKSTTTQLHSKKKKFNHRPGIIPKTTNILESSFYLTQIGNLGGFWISKKLSVTNERACVPRGKLGGQARPSCKVLKSEWFFVMGHKLKENSITNEFCLPTSIDILKLYYTILYLSCGSLLHTVLVHYLPYPKCPNCPNPVLSPNSPTLRL